MSIEIITGIFGGIAAVVASVGSVIAATRAHKFDLILEKIKNIAEKVEDLDNRLERVEDNQNAHLGWHMERVRR